MKALKIMTYWQVPGVALQLIGVLRKPYGRDPVGLMRRIIKRIALLAWEMSQGMWNETMSRIGWGVLLKLADAEELLDEGNVAVADATIGDAASDIIEMRIW